MRVLHVSRYFHPHVGGTENVIASLAAALEPLEVQSTVIVSRRRRSGPGPAPQVPVIEVPVIGPSRFPIPVGGVRAVIRAFRQADVVHVHDLRFMFEAAQVLSRLMRLPLVVGTHGLMFHTDAFAGIKGWLWRHYHARALRRVDLVVADSERDAAICRAVTVTENVTVVLDAVNTEPFLSIPDDAQRQEGLLLTFGRIAPEKSVERLAPVLRVAPVSWRLRIAGGGDAADVERVRRAFVGASDRVEVLGYVEEDVLVDELSRCMCVLLPSREEAFGLTLVEAMASGAPIVASDIAAYRELGEGTSVTLVDFDDAEQVVRAVKAAAGAPPDAAARARAAALSWTTTAVTYKEIYERVVRRRDREPGWCRVLGVDVQPLGLDGVLAAVADHVATRTPGTDRPGLVANHNLHSAALHRRDAALKRFYGAADHVFVDGMPLVWFGRLTGQGLSSTDRITYIDLIDPLLSLATARQWRVMMVAGTNESVRRGAAALRERHPGLDLVVRSGFFDAAPGSAPNEAVLAEINEAAPQILLVGMGMPRQEHWIEANLDRLHCAVVMNMGGLLDYVAGTKPTPPRWLARRGFEWAARLAAEPRRLAHRYLVEPWRLVPVAITELAGAALRAITRTARR